MKVRSPNRITVRLLAPVTLGRFNDKLVPAGASVSLEVDEANSLIASGKAELLTEDPRQLEFAITSIPEKRKGRNGVWH